MAIFWNNYNKEGPGVDPDEPEKGPIAGFFANYFSKFWRISGLGMLAIIGSILTLTLLYFVAFYLFPMLFPGFSMDNLLKSIEKLNFEFAEGVSTLSFVSTLYIVTHFIFVATIFALQFFVTGPIHAAVTYVMRNFARREPVFFWSDMKDAIKVNWKQSLMHSMISALALCLITYAYYFYGQTFEPGFLLYLVRSFMVIVLVFICIMQFYIYQMMVTFELKLKDIYKNALILAFAKLPTNLIILAIILIMGFVLPIYIFWIFPSQGTFMIISIFIVVIFIGFSYFLINYFASRGIIKYLLNHDEKDDKDDGDGVMSENDQQFNQEYEKDNHYSEEIPPANSEAGAIHSPA